VNRAEWRENLSVALATIASQKLRAFLTMLGVVIGVGSVISVAAIIHGLNSYVTGKLMEIGSKSFFIARFDPGVPVDRWNEETRTRRHLTAEDAAAIRDNCPTVQKASPILTRIPGFGGSNEARYGNNRVEEPFLRGGEPELEIVLPVYAVGEGRFFTHEEDRRGAMLCLLGDGLARSLFGPVDPIGHEVRVNGLPFEVVGIFEPHQGLFGGPGVDQFVIIPYRTFAKLYPESDEVIIGVSVRDAAQLRQAMDEAADLLRKRRRVPAGKRNDFEIVSPDLLTDLWAELTGAIVLLTLIVASIGLIVGGIGVMNVMLISVTERTAEIGVRKAVGARRSDIRTQFLLEAITLTGIGGLVGILAGVVISISVAHLFPSLPAQVSVFWTAMGLLISVTVGLFFGIYPAVKAANLDPVRCLRYE